MNLYEILQNSDRVGEGMTHFERLFAQKVGGGKINEISGVPPLRYIGDGRPLTDYMLYGNTVQNGTPTPEAPVDATGCGVRTGNLAPDIGWIDGYVNYAGRINPADDVLLEKTSDFIPLRSGVILAYSYRTGTFPDDGSGPWKAIGFYRSDKSFISRSTNETYASLFAEVPDDTAYIRLSLRTYGQDVSNVMLNLGSTALPYEPYGYKLPLTVNGTEYPIYLGQVETTRRIKKLVLTGEESWGKDANFDGQDDYFYTNPIPNITRDEPPISSHFISGAINVINSVWIGGRPSSPRIALEISKLYTGIASTDNKAARVAKFKSYLAAQYQNGTPVTVWYVLAEPETAIVNEPLMKIGDYADTVSFAQAGVTIPTVNGENVLDVPTEVKPSEVWIRGRIKEV